MKSLTPADPLQRSLLRLAQAGVSIYCPHTSVDAVQQGLNDWLADGISGGRWLERERRVIVPTEVKGMQKDVGMGRVVYLKDKAPISEIVNRVKKHLGIAHGI